MWKKNFFYQKWFPILSTNEKQNGGLLELSCRKKNYAKKKTCNKIFRQKNFLVKIPRKFDFICLQIASMFWMLHPFSDVASILILKKYILNYLLWFKFLFVITLCPFFYFSHNWMIPQSIHNFIIINFYFVNYFS